MAATSRRHAWRSLAWAAPIALWVQACGGGSGPTAGAGPSAARACDATLAAAYRPDDQARVVLVKSFAKGDALRLNEAAPTSATAPDDVCLVKLSVRADPAQDGAADGPAVGLEVWLPHHARWNERIRAFGTSGWGGGYHADPRRLGAFDAIDPAHLGALAKGYVVSGSNHGNPGTAAHGGHPAFLMKPDGTPDVGAWRVFSESSLRDQAHHTQALVQLYYGRPHRYAYFDGVSSGGRQGYKLAQRYPGSYHGILAGAPALYWSQLLPAQLHPQMAMQRGLGAPMAAAKLNLASARANAACSAPGLGFALDPLACTYDPLADAAALCVGEVGRAGIVGTHGDPARCLTAPEATIMNQIWYGPTTDGGAPNPADDAGGALGLGGSRAWWGLARGAWLKVLAGPQPFWMATDQIALTEHDAAWLPTVLPGRPADSSVAPFDRWKTLDAAWLAGVMHSGQAQQSAFADIDTTAPDLSAFAQAGGRLLAYHGLADEYVPPLGTLHYFDEASHLAGGTTALQAFHRVFLIPGMGHDTWPDRTGLIDSATGEPLAPERVPMPQTSNGRDELFEALRQWVEDGSAPERIDLRSRDDSISLPICSYPAKAVYIGSASRQNAAAYTCI